MTGPAERGVVLFDLDGVLTTKDTFATLVSRRLVRSPWRLLLALAALPALHLTRRRPQLRGAVSRYLVRVALLGVDLAHARRLAGELATEFARTPQWLRQRCIDLAADHLRAGDRVVVVTATAAEVARPLLDAVGLGDAELRASSLSPARGGTRLSPHNYGRRKLDSLQGVSRPWHVMYSDSAADLPVLQETQEVVLVAPSPGLVATVRAACAPAIPVRTIV